MITHDISTTKQLINAANGDTINLPSLIGLPLSFFAIITVDSSAQVITLVSDSLISGKPSPLVYSMAGFNVLFINIDPAIGWNVTPFAINISDIQTAINLGTPLSASNGGTGSDISTEGVLSATMVGDVIEISASNNIDITGSITQNLDTDVIGHTIQAANGQTADLFNINSHNGDTILRVNAFGSVEAFSNMWVPNGFIISSWAVSLGIPTQQLVRFAGQTGNIFEVNSGFGTGGDFFCVNASGNTIMSNGSYIRPSAPPEIPSSGWVLYCDSNDANKLKARSNLGNIVEIGTPS